MNESKIEATDRLRREGRWEVASKYRDEVRKRLKGEGKTRTEANDAAWEAMLEKYPPTEPPLEQLELVKFPVEKTRDHPDSERDWLWAATHLHRAGVVALDAPSSFAWSLLVWGRTESNYFVPQAVKVLERKEERDREAAEDSDEIDREMDVDEARKLLRQAKRRDGEECDWYADREAAVQCVSKALNDPNATEESMLASAVEAYEALVGEEWSGELLNGDIHSRQ